MLAFDFFIKSKASIAVAVCANRKGTVKLNPFIIGQRKHPHRFRRQSLRVEDYCIYNYNTVQRG